jgi:hypothetical protein
MTKECLSLARCFLNNVSRNCSSDNSFWIESGIRVTCCHSQSWRSESGSQDPVYSIVLTYTYMAVAFLIESRRNCLFNRNLLPNNCPLNETTSCGLLNHFDLALANLLWWGKKCLKRASNFVTISGSPFLLRLGQLYIHLTFLLQRAFSIIINGRLGAVAIESISKKVFRKLVWQIYQAFF